MNTQVNNILDELELRGEEALKKKLSSFSCPINPKIENFLRNRSIDFARRKISITYTVNDLDDGQILGFFALTHKAILIPSAGLSSTSRRKLERFARLDRAAGEYMASAFLIAQLGKNYGVDDGRRITGADLMRTANDILVNIQHQIGGGVIYLDSEDIDTLKQFYSSMKFLQFGDRFSEEEAQKYIQYMRFF